MFVESCENLFLKYLISFILTTMYNECILWAKVIKYKQKQTQCLSLGSLESGEGEEQLNRLWYKNNLEVKKNRNKKQLQCNVFLMRETAG